MKSEQLQCCFKKDLIDMARKRGVTGWHGMAAGCTGSHFGCSRIIDSFPVAGPVQPGGRDYRFGREDTRPAAGGGRRSTPAPPRAKSWSNAANMTWRTHPRPVRQGSQGFAGGLRQRSYRYYGARSLWLHAYWELMCQAIQRAEAALGQDWHGAKPILRLLDVSSHDTTSSAESTLRDIDIHGGCNNWYIDVANPPALTGWTSAIWPATVSSTCWPVPTS